MQDQLLLVHCYSQQPTLRWQWTAVYMSMLPRPEEQQAMHATKWQCPAAAIRRQGPTCMLMMKRLQLLGAPTFECGHAFSLRWS